MNKILVSIITVMALIACDEESSNTSTSITTETKYTIEELENDTNWVEITDIDTVRDNNDRFLLAVQFKNIDSLYFKQHFFYFNDLDNFIEFYDEYKHEAAPQTFLDSFDLNFSNRALFLFYTDESEFNIVRRIFVNKLSNKLVYNLEYIYNDFTFEMELHAESISIPKFEGEIILNIIDPGE